MLCDIAFSKMYRLIRCKQFPPAHPRPRNPLQRGRSLRRWKVEEVEDWLKNKDNDKLKTTKPPKKPKPQRNIEAIALSVTIEDDIPIPPVRPMVKPPFLELKVNQSFFVASIYEQRPRYVGLGTFRKEHPEREIIQRARVENGVKGHRYWRRK